MQERRSFARMDIEGSVCIKREDASQPSYEAHLDNISFGGFAAFRQEKLELNQVIDFVLTTPLLEHPLEGQGRICYCVTREEKIKFFSMGVEFTKINTDMITYLLKRLQMRSCQQARHRHKTPPLDFIPY